MKNAKRLDEFAQMQLDTLRKWGHRREIVFDGCEQERCREWLKDNGIKVTRTNIEKQSREKRRREILLPLHHWYLQYEKDPKDDIKMVSHRLRNYIEYTYGARADEIVEIWYAK